MGEILASQKNRAGTHPALSLYPKRFHPKSLKVEVL
jgi:hypothetical protein